MGIHPTLEVATLGMWDTMIVMIMALVVFGPRRLPMIGRQIGKLMYEFRKASNDFRFQMEEELRNAEEADRQREADERRRALAATQGAQPAQIDATIATAEAGADADSGQSSGEYEAAGEPGSPGSYDEAYEQYQRRAADREAEPEPQGLRVKPPESGTPVPAERPTSRASAAALSFENPAEAADSPAKSAAAAIAPSRNEAVISQPRELNVDDPAPQIPPASEASAEREPAAHHG